MNANRFRMMKFDLNNMVDHAAIVMIAKRGSGKSWVCRDIVYNMRKKIPGGVVIAPTDKMNSFYKYFFPDLYIHYEIKPSILNNILLRQKMMIQKEKEKKKEGKTINPSGILVMDDCLAQKGKWAKDTNILEIMMNGRHYKLTYILTMQTPLGVTPDLRLNFDYVFILKEDSRINMKKLYENYASMFPTFMDFNAVFSKCTKDNCCMVIDNRKPTETIQEKVFWFKAEERKFAFGSEEFKRIHKKYYDPSWQNKSISNMINNSGLLKKKLDDEMKIDLVK